MTTATLKAKILAELEQLPEEALAQTLAYVQRLNAAPQIASSEEAMQAYLASEQEYNEVYTRLMMG
ncbi:DUF2281 domain-containing protein [Nodosilinea sp. P-1105]|uniref:DUF2281 domain-containing protein n=1 Tax=Nodosilinea sp. P-1105 TaxID=2546229 RepID=UPI00146AC8D6|nr:DUF2281 domain-containing protein [Nodosilinea sp. P-1105]NMF82728.1 DUF2281 domain-containing protein [Nodosilinea sp. P-1105]